MGWLYRTALRLVTRKRLKSERTRLLLEKSWLLTDARKVLIDPADGGTGEALARHCDDMRHVNAQLDAVNNEIGRRGR
jgi:hypothetical protein